MRAHLVSDTWHSFKYKIRSSFKMLTRSASLNWSGTYCLSALKLYLYFLTTNMSIMWYGMVITVYQVYNNQPTVKLNDWFLQSCHSLKTSNNWSTLKLILHACKHLCSFFAARSNTPNWILEVGNTERENICCQWGNSKLNQYAKYFTKLKFYFRKWKTKQAIIVKKAKANGNSSF